MRRNVSEDWCSTNELEGELEWWKGDSRGREAIRLDCVGSRTKLVTIENSVGLRKNLWCSSFESNDCHHRSIFRMLEFEKSLCISEGLESPSASRISHPVLSFSVIAATTRNRATVCVCDGLLFHFHFRLRESSSLSCHLLIRRMTWGLVFIVVFSHEGSI